MLVLNILFLLTVAVVVRVALNNCFLAKHLVTYVLTVLLIIMLLAHYYV